MNKMLTISIVAVLGVLGGGTYFLSQSDKNFSEYVPESISEALGDYLPSNFKTEQLDVVETSQNSPLFEDAVELVEGSNEMVVEDSIEVVEDSIEVVEEPIEIIEKSVQVEVEPEVQQVVEESGQAMEQVAEQDSLIQGDADVVDIAMQEIQNSLDGNSTPVKVTSQNPKVKFIEEKIVAASSRISKLNMENKALEDKFQNILRKNRELAKKLQEIDKKITQSN